MSQVTYKNRSEKTEKKKVEFYNGTGSSVTLHQGYAFCYDQDYGTASDASLYRIWRVERPATANLLYFAGVLTEGYDGEIVANGETKVVEIYVPNRRGQGVLVWTEESCTINATYLAPQNGVFALGAASDSYTVALAAQTVDRSVTNGTVLARLFGVDLNQVGIESELTAAESELDLVSEAVVAVDSQLLLAESEIADLDSQLLLIESEAADNASQILLLESETATNSANIAAAESELDLVSEALVAESSQIQANSEAITAGVGTAVSTAVVALDSQLLLVESEAAQAQSEVDVVDSQLLLVESEVAAVDSQLLLLESEAAGLASEILLLESETAEVVDSDAITSGIVTTSSVTIHKAQISIRGVTYTFVTDIVAKA
jgi:uncharacterized protein YheU (UPF0270 family)